MLKPQAKSNKTVSQSFHGNRNVRFVCIFSYYKYYITLHYLCISVLILQMWKLRCREIKQLSQGKWWVKYMIGWPSSPCELGVAVCLALARGMWREVCVTLGRMSPWSRMCFAFFPWWHILDIEKLPSRVCKWGSRGVAMPTALPWMWIWAEIINVALSYCDLGFFLTCYGRITSDINGNFSLI